jgi:uncharacterized protein YqhQ
LKKVVVELKKSKTGKTPISVGGQALMEGIMMRGPGGLSMSLRLPDGTIETTKRTVKQLKDKYKIFGWPFFRGVVGFIESMVLGYKCLMESAEKTGFDSVEEEDMSKFDKWLTNHLGEKMMSVIGAISAVLGFGLAFLLFFWFPSFIFDFLNSAVAAVLSNWRAIIEGVIRIIIFVFYMAGVAQLKDIKRLYMYHGAEHKSIFCFENGEALTVENVRKQKRFHPRCGTSFIFVMIILSILISSIIAISFPAITQVRAIWLIVKLSLVPIIMSIGFEFIKYAGCHQNLFVKILSAPGLWMQRITTKEPTDDIIEVGIEALKAVLLTEDKELIKEPSSLEKKVSDSTDGAKCETDSFEISSNSENAG